jgi:hypothetical protein
MGYNSHTVVFLARATRLTGGICLLIWLIAVGIAIFSSPDQSTPNPTVNFLQEMEASAGLYLVPGVILFVLAGIVKAGRLWPAPVILLISALSLAKLVLLMTALGGPFFQPPLSCEIPARLACAMLSVGCVYAWEDLADMNRTRWRTRRGSRMMQTPRAEAVQPPQAVQSPRPAQSTRTGQSPPAKPKTGSASSKPAAPPGGYRAPPPPSTQIPRPRLKRDEPPSSQTPWS